MTSLKNSEVGKGTKLSLSRKRQKDMREIAKKVLEKPDVLNETCDFKDGMTFSGAGRAMQAKLGTHSKEGGDDGSEDVSECYLCKKSLAHMNVQRQQQHINKCMDRLEEEGQAEREKKQQLETASVAVLNCPMCGKAFKSAASRRAHLKRCSVVNGVSTETVLKLTKAQEEERKASLASGVVPSSVGTSVSAKSKSTGPGKIRKIREPRSQYDEDVQMALALSNSMREQQKLESGDLIGPVASSSSSVKGKETKRNKKKVLEDVCLLTTLTDEDRQRRLEEKVNNILLPEEAAGSPPENAPRLFQSCLGQHEEPSYQLWARASQTAEPADTGLATIGTESKDMFYVGALMPPITMDTMRTGSKFKRLSSIPGRDVSMMHGSSLVGAKNDSPGGLADISLAPTQTVMVLAELMTADDNDTSQTQVGMETIPHLEGNTSQLQASGFCVQKLILKADDKVSAQTQTLLDYRQLVNNPDSSDINITTNDRGTLFAHKVILITRCPKIIQLLKGTTIHLDISLDAALAFLNYIYTGELTLCATSVSEISELSNTLELPDLNRLCSLLVPEDLSEHHGDKDSDGTAHDVTNQNGETGREELFKSVLNLKEIWGESDSDSDDDVTDDDVDKQATDRDGEIDAEEYRDIMCTQRRRLTQSIRSKEGTESQSIQSTDDCNDSVPQDDNGEESEKGIIGRKSSVNCDNVSVGADRSPKSKRPKLSICDNDLNETGKTNSVVTSNSSVCNLSEGVIVTAGETECVDISDPVKIDRDSSGMNVMVIDEDLHSDYPCDKVNRTIENNSDTEDTFLSPHRDGTSYCKASHADNGNTTLSSDKTSSPGAGTVPVDARLSLNSSSMDLFDSPSPVRKCGTANASPVNVNRVTNTKCGTPDHVKLKFDAECKSTGHSPMPGSSEPSGLKKSSFNERLNIDIDSEGTHHNLKNYSPVKSFSKVNSINSPHNTDVTDGVDDIAITGDNFEEISQSSPTFKERKFKKRSERQCNSTRICKQNSSNMIDIDDIEKGSKERNPSDRKSQSLRRTVPCDTINIDDNKIGIEEGRNASPGKRIPSDEVKTDIPKESNESFQSAGDLFIDDDDADDIVFKSPGKRIPSEVKIGIPNESNESFQSAGDLFMDDDDTDDIVFKSQKPMDDIAEDDAVVDMDYNTSKHVDDCIEVLSDASADDEDLELPDIEPNCPDVGNLSRVAEDTGDGHDGGINAFSQHPISPIADVWEDFDDCGVQFVPADDLPQQRTIDSQADQREMDATCGQTVNSSGQMDMSDGQIDICDGQTDVHDGHDSSFLQDGDDSFVFHMETDPALSECTNGRDEGSKPSDAFKTPSVREKVDQDKRPWVPPSPFTPMPDYDGMSTPALKKRVHGFGVKPVGKKRMVKVLKDIYSQTHQYETDSECEIVEAESEQPEEEVDINLSQGTISSQGSDMSDVFEESCLQVDTSSDSDAAASPQKSADINKKLSGYIKNHPDIHLRVLQYEPLELDVLKKAIKEAGIKCSMDKLMDFLDGQCIAFTNKNTRKRGANKLGKKKTKAKPS